ncbi:hypothetical protein M5689_020721 [Euphorbia peplus]|nr:hypothetical protein M5689_020721 [Euphorbia peplus]
MPEKFMKPWTVVEMVFIPINHSFHWFLGAFMVHRHHIYLYDTLPAHMSKEAELKVMTTITSTISARMKESGMFQDENLKKNITWSRVDGVPQHVFKSNDCGTWVMALSRILVERKEKEHKSFSCNFDGTIGAHLRLRFAVEIFHRKLIGFDMLEDNIAAYLFC